MQINKNLIVLHMVVIIHTQKHCTQKNEKKNNKMTKKKVALTSFNFFGLFHNLININEI